jgi:hypothetical protein
MSYLDSLAKVCAKQHWGIEVSAEREMLEGIVQQRIGVAVYTSRFKSITINGTEASGIILWKEYAQCADEASKAILDKLNYLTAVK